MQASILTKPTLKKRVCIYMRECIARSVLVSKNKEEISKVYINICYGFTLACNL